MEKSGAAQRWLAMAQKKAELTVGSEAIAVHDAGPDRRINI